MSSYYRPAYHPPTGTVRDALWADDYFGRHQYGVRFDGDETAYKPEDVAIPADKVFVSQELLRESEYSLSLMEGAYISEKERVRELEREVQYLRHYGNKDCTAMAEEAMANRKMEPPR